MICIKKLVIFAVATPSETRLFLWLRTAFSLKVESVAAIVILTP